VFSTSPFDGAVDLARAPDDWIGDAGRRLVVIPIGGFDRRATAALGYARRISAVELRAVHVASDDRALSELADAWMAHEVGWPLHVIDDDGGTPATVARFVASQLEAGFDQVVVVLGRIELRRRYHRLLHDRSADAIARTLHGAPRVVVGQLTVATT